MNKVKISTALFLTALLIQTSALGAKEEERMRISEDWKAAGGKISSQTIRAHTKFLSSDLFEGRAPGSRGDSLAQEYLATQMEGMGLSPGGSDGTWFQDVPLVGVTSHVPKILQLNSKNGNLNLAYFDEFIAVSGTQNKESQIKNAEIIFVGYGIVAPEYDWNDFKDVDVKGKVLLVMNNDPADNPDLFEGNRRLYYGRWTYKYEQAAKMGAVGAIIIHTTPSASYPWQVIQTSWTGESFKLPDDGSPHLEMEAWTTDEASKKIVKLGGHDLDDLRKKAQAKDFRPVALGVNLSVSITNTVKKNHSRNVIGVIKGSDPVLSKQAVIYTAHHDHLGIKADTKPGEDAIYNGALDNASGVAVVLSVAKAFSDLKKRPKRSVYFLFVAAEEQGLLGSAYFAKNPVVLAGNIAANINVDGANIFGRTREVSMVGKGKSSLDSIIEALCATQGRVLEGEAFPDSGGFYRSDQFNFAKIGVPAAYVHSGTDLIGKPKGFGKKQSEEYIKNNYHQPSDEYQESWDFSGAVEDAQIVFNLGAIVADSKRMPEWKKGDEFEAARLKALKEVSASEKEK